MGYKKSIETKNNIIEACKKLILTKAWDDITVRDIAKEANIKNPLIYYYYDNKQEIAETTYAMMVLKIIDFSMELVPFEEDMLLNHFIHVILTYKCVVNNPIYNKFFMEAINPKFDTPPIMEFQEISTIIEDQLLSIFHENDIQLEKKYATAYVVTTYAVSNSMFKSIISHKLDFSFDEAIIFVTKFWVSSIGIPDVVYQSKISKAISLCNTVDMNQLEL
ncbi:MAG: TetR/AcrR family transcriptional regulator [Eubacteriales bacterium]